MKIQVLTLNEKNKPALFAKSAGEGRISDSAIGFARVLAIVSSQNQQQVKFGECIDESPESAVVFVIAAAPRSAHRIARCSAELSVIFTPSPVQGY